MLQTSFAKLDEGWGVRVHGNPATTSALAGREIDVNKRSGGTKRVRLGAQVHSWNGGRTRVYRIDNWRCS